MKNKIAAKVLNLITNLLRCSIFILSTLLIQTTTAYSSDLLLEADRTSTIELLLERAIQHKLISGGVVLIGNSDEVLYSVSTGTIGTSPNVVQISAKTLFDIASLTKVIATAPAIMKLLQDQKINLLDPITRWFPELEESAREDITILHLLTHTSGLHDISISGDQPMTMLFQKALSQSDKNEPGKHFYYADINFILLAELVQRASGLRFDEYCRKNLYEPLGMLNSMFLPPNSLKKKIAPTLGSGGEFQTGVVQDENSRHLGGIAGHAGLFSTAEDLSHFARMLLKQGVWNDKEIFSPTTTAQMTAPYFFNKGEIIRGLGWDIHSPFSSPRGDTFSPLSYGHTGYSGSSLWIDPEKELYVILLTVRTDYHNKREFNRLRSDISTMASALFSQPVEVTNLLKTLNSSDLLKP